MEHIKAGGKFGYMKFNRDVLAAAMACKLNGCQWAVLIAVALHSWGLPKPKHVSTLTERTLPSKVRAYSRKTVYVARNQLVERHILYMYGPHLAINPIISEWEGICEGTFELTRSNFVHLQIVADANRAGRDSDNRPMGDYETDLGTEKRPPKVSKTSAEGLKNESLEGVFREREREQLSTGDGDDGKRWIIRACIGWLIDHGHDKDTSAKTVKALAAQIGSKGEIDWSLFCDALDGMIGAQMTGLDIVNPAGFAIANYRSGIGTGEPLKGTVAEPGRLLKIFEHARQNANKNEIENQAREIIAQRKEPKTKPVPPEVDKLKAYAWWRGLTDIQRIDLYRDCPGSDGKWLHQCIGGHIPDFPDICGHAVRRTYARQKK